MATAAAFHDQPVTWGSTGAQCQGSLGERFAGAIAFVARLTSLCQQPAAISEHFQTAEEMVLDLPLSELESSVAVRRLGTARKLQSYREFGAARHELCLLRRCLIRTQRALEPWQRRKEHN